jgi:hypothetical protein
MFDAFAKLDPLLQVIAIVAIVAFVVVGALRLRLYLRKRRMRKRSKGWVTF